MYFEFLANVLDFFPSEYDWNNIPNLGPCVLWSLIHS